MPPIAKSIEELFPLIDFCRAGNLRAVSAWIAEGKPLDPPPGKRTRRSTPLQIAIEKGFLTLSEILLDGGANPCANNGNALIHAIDHKRADIAKLLLDRGVAMDSISFGEVCSSGDPDTIKLFLDRGADPIKDLPFYHGFLACLNPLLGAYKDQIQRFPELQIQADMALCHYAREGNLRCVSLLIWAGAKPEADIPENLEGISEFAGSCAMTQAVWGGHLEVLKRMKPGDFPDKLPEILGSCVMQDSPQMLEYVISLLPPLNNLPDKGSSIMDRAFWHMSWAADPKPVFGVRSPTKIDAAIERINFLAKHGAKWAPSAESIRSARRYIRHLEPEKILRVFANLREQDAADISFLETLVATPTMRTHLGDFTRKIAHLFHPPPVKAGTSPRPSKSVPPAETVKASLPELRAAGEKFIKNFLRKIPAFHFWKNEIWQYFETQQVRRSLDMPKDDHRSCFEILQKAAETITKYSQSFSVAIEGSDYRGTVSSITITLLKNKEWTDVCDEIWDSDNPRRISIPSLSILSWVREFGSSTNWIKERSLSWKAGLHGRTDDIELFLIELRTKLGSSFNFEKRGQRYNSNEYPVEYRVWLDGEVSADTPIIPQAHPKTLNPILEGSLDHIRKEDIDAWRNAIHEHILSSRPSGDEKANILRIGSRKELEKVFPTYQCNRWSPGDKIVEFISEIPLHRELEIAYDFSDKTDTWFLSVFPVTSWEITLKALEELQNQPSLQERYGLSAGAAKLLEWIEDLREADYLGNWTPIVEEEMDSKIGIESPWGDENFSAYVQTLLDEINQKTLYALQIQPWRDYSKWKTRIRVSKKESDESSLIKQIQFFGLQHGKLLESSCVQKVLKQLLQE